MRFILCLLILLACSGTSYSSDGYERPRDFWTWYSIQVQKSTFDYQYASVQCQLRYNDNASTFNRTNLYFTYGYDWTNNLNVELIYQLNMNYDVNQHTIYLSATRKFKLHDKLNFYFRSKIQHTQNYFTGDYSIDEPLTVWRNRFRFTYRFNKQYSLALSAEPYLAFDGTHRWYWSRTRYVAQGTYRMNKFNSMSIFYLVQPDVIDFGTPGTNYALGLTYSLTLPDRPKDYARLFKGSKKSNGSDKSRGSDKDTFQ